MIVIGGVIKIKPEKREEALALIRHTVTETHKEAGNNRYFFSVHVDEPNTLLFFEEWATAEALDAHLKTPHLLKFFADLPAMLTAPLDAKKYVVESASSL